MDKSTDPKTGAEARAKILSGVNKTMAVVAATLGPAGRSVILPRSYNRGPRVADDGYYAAENVILKDPHERLAADVFKEGIKKTNLMAGDGTTGCGVLSAAIINKVFREMPTSDVPIVLPPCKKQPEKKSVRQARKELNDAKTLVIEEIKQRAKPIKTLAELEKVASVSIGKEDEAIAKTIAKVVWETARDSEGNYIENHIDITEGYKGEIETEVIRGMRFPAKVSALAFVNKPERHEMVAEDTPVLLTNLKIDSPHVIGSVLQALKVPKLAIFAPDYSVGVLQYLVEVCKGGLHVFPIKCPALRTVQLEDLGAYIGAQVIDKEQGMKLENVTPLSLGFAEKIVVKSVENTEDATLLGGRGEKVTRGPGNLIDERIKVLKGQLKEVRNELERIQLEKRIANLGSAVGVIRVGASTAQDALFIKLKIEDGVYACKGALEEGYVKGGGLCLKEIAEKLPENILTEALKAPYEQIQKNAGGEFPIEKDIIDPAKVVRMIVEHGVSVAATLITAHAIVPEIPEKTEADGLEMVAKALMRNAYYIAKHQGQLKNNEDEAEQDRQRDFERVLYEDKYQNGEF